MNQYDKDDVLRAANCIEVAQALGLELNKESRCRATWRGGDNETSVNVTDSGFYDFATESGGDVIELVEMVHNGGNKTPMTFQAALRWLGEYYRLTPQQLQSNPTAYKSRYDQLLDEGYSDVKRYDYTDANGALVQQVVRLEHPERGKQFLQCDASGKWGVREVEPVLYNLPAITKSDWAIVVEGEKDADTLIAWGLPATTNAGGAKKWRDSYNDALAGKNIVLLPDNDEAGRAHLDVIGLALHGNASRIKALTVSSLPKGDVTDWATSEGGTAAKLSAMIKAAPDWTPPTDRQAAVAAAKEANKTKFSNYYMDKTVVDGKPKYRKAPRNIHKMIDDLFVRLLNFPRRIGESLFDQDRDTGKVEYLHTVSQFFGWMALKTGQNIEWTGGDGMVPKEEFLESVRSRAQRYEAISLVPDYPLRESTYYCRPDLPPPSKGHKVFEALVDKFAPATPEDRVLIKTFFCAPMFYREDIPRPLWVVDSPDGCGTGKTTLVEAVAKLYGSGTIDSNKRSIKFSMDDLVRRIISPSGREKRVLLVDNVSGTFHSDELSSLVTKASISGRPAYGRGESTRPNDLTFAITANAAMLDNDLAVRSFFIYLVKSDITSEWKTELLEYVKQFRYEIFADIVDRIQNHHVPIRKTSTRFPEFERQILIPNCDDESQYRRVIEYMKSNRDESNSEEDLAQNADDIIAEKLIEHQIYNPEETAVFIATRALEIWLSGIMPNKANVGQIMRNIARNGLSEKLKPEPRRYPENRTGYRRVRGILWDPSDIGKPSIIIDAIENTVTKLDQDGKKIWAPAQRRDGFFTN